MTYVTSVGKPTSQVSSELRPDPCSPVFGILSVLPMIKDISRADANLSYMSLYITLSVVLNLLVTILISSRLLLARRKLASLFPSSRISNHYTGVIAILIESAIPLSVAGLGLAVVLGITHSGDPDLLEKEIANYFFSAFYFNFAVCQYFPLYFIPNWLSRRCPLK